jgi:hypothetical protein
VASAAFGALQLDEPLATISSLIEGATRSPRPVLAARGERLDFSAVRGERG